MSTLTRIRFCFKLSAELGMANDIATGEPAEAFMEVGTYSEVSLNEEEHKQMHESVKLIVADQLKIDPSMITPITADEFDEAAGDELDGLQELEEFDFCEDCCCDDCSECHPEEEDDCNGCVEESCENCE